MTTRDLVLAALSVADRAPHEPVQVQKLLFLVDRNIADLVDGPHFDFRPRDYGPFDPAVYEELEALELLGLVEITPYKRWRRYALTSEGQARGDAAFAGMAEPAREYLREASHFVRRLSFADLVSAIYRAYPEMREKSIFK